MRIGEAHEGDLIRRTHSYGFENELVQTFRILDIKIDYEMHSVRADGTEYYGGVKITTTSMHTFIFTLDQEIEILDRYYAKER